jgi:RNA polymerase sigma-70 factor (ECF subfamily)
MISDKELHKLLITKPEKGLEKLMDTYGGLAYVIVQSKASGTASMMDIEECVSDIFYEMYVKRDEIDLEKGTIKSFLAVIAARRAIDLFRRRSKESAVSAVLEELQVSGAEPAAEDYSVENTVINLETSALLIKAIKALGSPDSEIIIRKYYFGQSTKTIAQALNLKENTVDKKVSRGLVKLKKALGGVL